MKKITLFVALIAFISNLAIAQKAKDYIITNSDDTIRGQIIGSTPSINSVRIGFEDTETKTKKNYKAYEIKSWHPAGVPYYFESKEYRPLGMKPEEHGFGVFMKRKTLYDAPVKVYEYWNTDGQNGYTQVFLEKRGKMIEVDFMNFNKQLSEYFSDYLDLSNKIKEKKYKKKDLEKIVEEYNTWKNKKA